MEKSTELISMDKYTLQHKCQGGEKFNSNNAYALAHTVSSSSMCNRRDLTASTSDSEYAQEG